MKRTSVTSRAFERRMSSARRQLRGGARVRKWSGVTVASTSDYYATANPGGVAGQAAGFWAGAAICITSQAVASGNKRVISRDFGGNSGWQLLTTGTNGGILGNFYDGGGVARNTPSFTVTAGHLNRVLPVAIVYDGTRVRLYVLGTESGGGTLMTGFTAYNGPMSFASAVNAPVGMRLVGCCGGHAVPSAGELTAWSAAVLAAKDVVSITGKTDHLYSVARDQAGSAPATITDRVGSDNLSKNGSPALVRFSA